MAPHLQGLWQKTLDVFLPSVSSTDGSTGETSHSVFQTGPTGAVSNAPQSGDSVSALRVHKATQTAPFSDALTCRTAAARNPPTQDASHLLYMNTATQIELPSPMTMQTGISSPRTEQTSCSVDSRSESECNIELNYDRKAPAVTEKEGETYIEALTPFKGGDGVRNDGPKIFDGPSQVVVGKHNDKPCLALLVTKEMIENMNEIARLSRELAYVEPKYEEADQDVNYTRLTVGYYEDAIEVAESQDEIDRYRRTIEQRQGTLLADCLRYEELHGQVTSLKRNLKYYEDSSQGMLKEVLDNAGLLSAPIEYGSQGEDADEDDDVMSQAYRSEAASSQSDVSYVSIERLARCAAHAELDERYAELIEKEQDFENAREAYEYEKEEFLQSRLDDPDFEVSLTEFDLTFLQDQQQATRSLCVAEGAYEEALARWRKYGPNQWDQESGFVTEEGDGYPNDGNDLSWEVDGPASAPSDYIFGWMKDIPDVEYPPDIAKLDLGAGLEFGREDREDVDICDIRSAQLSDAWSSRDTTRNRRRIDRWRAITGRDR
ncbi:MAG: hypothetical protein Q9171_005402 [Xanthocarpia ochracea]